MTQVTPRPISRANPSMQDVAHHAGVSLGTVSNVLNHPEKVMPATAVRVRSSIDELGFVRNDAARALAAGSSRSLGLVLADIENSLFIDMVHGAQQGSKAAGLSLLLGNAACDLQQQEDYLDLFDEARVAGVLLAPMEDSSAGIRRMRAHGRQIVLLGYSPKDDDCCAVLVDNERVGYLAAQHLIESGRTRLAFIAGHDSYQPVHDRRLGVKRAVAESDGRVTVEEIDSGGLEHEDGQRIGAALLERSPGEIPDGVIAVTDAIGNGLIQRIMASGALSVPRDISVIGCENNRSAVSGPVPLSTVQPPGHEMGQQATSLLLEEIAALPGEHSHRTLVLQPTLVIRESTAVPTISRA